MLRNEWRFVYPASDLAEAAKKKVKHHAERVVHYTAEYEKAKEALRTPSHQGLAHPDQVSMSVHERLVGDYGRVATALKIQEEDMELALDLEDIAWFGLGDS